MVVPLTPDLRRECPFPEREIPLVFQWVIRGRIDERQRVRSPPPWEREATPRSLYDHFAVLNLSKTATQFL